MKKTTCCNYEVRDKGLVQANQLAERESRNGISWFRRLRSGVRWSVPGVLLVIIPKCPVCFAAWIATASGIGISIHVAGWIRLFLILVCLASLSWLLVQQMTGLLRKLRSRAVQ